MNDEQLVKQFQSGDRQAFDELLLRYQDKVLNTCFRFIAREEDARDATQDIFIKVYHALHSFKPKATFSTWLYRIAVNHSLNIVRSNKRRAWLKSFSMAADPNELYIIADAKDPHTKMEHDEQAALVQRALKKLNQEQRVAIILHRFEGLSYKEIAEVMNTSVSSVESRLFRARQKLARFLKDAE
jgi:RNA polymerase sigma-70 factor (ECF subfamily)